MAREQDEHDDSDDGESLEKGIASFFDENVDGSGGARERDEDADDDEQDEDAEDSDEGDEDDEPDDSDDDDEEDDDESEEDSDDDDEGEEEDEEEDDSDDDDALDPEIEAAAARHQLPTNFEDIVRKLPKEARAAARQAFSKRLKEVESGLGRAFQEARGERKELTRLKAERAHEETHRIDHIADLIDGDPKLLGQLNEELEKREVSAYREAKQKERKIAKAELDRSAEEATTKAEARRQRGQQVVSLAQRLARDAGVPYKVIDKAIYIAVLNSPEKDVTDEQIRRIVKQEARDWRKLTGERKTEKKKEYIQRKSKQIRDGKRRVSARDRGHAPAPGRRREPKNLREALERRAASILPDAPAE